MGTCLTKDIKKKDRHRIQSFGENGAEHFLNQPVIEEIDLEPPSPPLQFSVERPKKRESTVIARRSSIDST